MTRTVVIGKTLADAEAYAQHYSLADAELISPRSALRFRGLQFDRFCVTPRLFDHPDDARKMILTASRIVVKQ